MKNGMFHRRTNFSVKVMGHVLKTDEEEDSADSDNDQRHSIVVEYIIKVIKAMISRVGKKHSTQEAQDLLKGMWGEGGGRGLTQEDLSCSKAYVRVRVEAGLHSTICPWVLSGQ